MSTGIRVGLVDGDLEMRAGRRLMLDASRDTIVVFEENSTTAVLEKFDDYLIDVLVVDQRLRLMSGTELVAALSAIKLQTGNLTRLLLTAPYGSDRLNIAAIQAGAQAVVSQDEPAKVLIDRIKALHAGASQFSVEYMKVATGSLGMKPKPDHAFEVFIESLKPDERSILQLLLSGETAQQVAKQRDLAVYRIGKILENAMLQLKACTLEQLQLRNLMIGSK